MGYNFYKAENNNDIKLSNNEEYQLIKDSIYSKNSI